MSKRSLGPVREFLNRGLHIADSTVLFADIPEADPTLVTEGYSIVRTQGVTEKVIPPFILVIADFVGGTVPTAELSLWGYATPPSAGAALVSNWQRVSRSRVADTVKPSMAILPAVGFSRFYVGVTDVTGTPTSVRLRIIAISAHTADILLQLGIIGKNYPDGQALAVVTNGADGTYNYYIDLAHKDVFGLWLDLDGGTAGAGPAGVTATVELSLDGVNYVDVTNDAFGVASLNAAPGATVTDLWINTTGMFRVGKYVRVVIVSATNGPDTGDWSLYERSV